MFESFGEEIFIDRLSLNGGTVTANQVTGLSALTNIKYQDQDVRVLSGVAAGKILRCVTNTATSITFQENVESLGITAGDALVFGSRGKRPTTYNVPLLVKDELHFPNQKNTFEQPRYLGFGQKPADSIPMKVDFPGSIPFPVADGRLPFMMFGDEYVTGTDVTGGGGSTLSVAVYAGETVVTLTAVTSYTAGDLVQIGTSTVAEIRKVSAVDTTNKTLTLDYPLRKSHALTTGQYECNEVTKPFTHTLQYLDRGVYFTLQGGYDESTPIVMETHGLFSKKLEIKGMDQSYVAGKLDVEGMTDDVSGTKKTWSDTPVMPYKYDLVVGGISYNGITYAQVIDWTVTCARGLITHRYQTDIWGLKPNGFSTDKFEMEADITLDVANRNILDLLRAATASGAGFTVGITASKSVYVGAAYETHTMTITGTMAQLTEATHTLPPEGATVRVNPKAKLEDITISFVDNIPYYPMGVPI